MANQIAEMSSETAASLILRAYCLHRGETIKTSFLRNQRYDVIANRVPLSTEEYAGFTFWVVKRGTAKSATRALGETVLKSVVSALVDHAKNELSPVHSVASDVSGAMETGSGGMIDTKEIYSNATKIGGQMQLHAAKKMGRDAYDQTRTWGLTAHRYHDGAVRFDGSDAPPGITMHMRTWGADHAASWVDRFQGADARYGAGDQFAGIDSMSSDWLKAQFFYSASTGAMTKA
ncbi:MAG: hypothetical protein AAGB93_10690 [Planctomycetota bacterium]